MTRLTVDLSKARTYSRNKRAGKAVRILRDSLGRKLEDYRVANEVNHEIWDRGASRPPKSIEVEFDESEEVPTVTLAESTETVQETSEPEPEPEPEQEEDEEETESQANVESDYEEALDGTVSEVKEAVKEMDDPDYSRLLQLEKVGKDRKTLKEWLESR